MAKKREVVETLSQGEDEEISYSVDTSPWGGSPTGVSVVVKDENGTDVTSTVMPVNSPTVNVDTITLSALKSLTAGVTYRIEVKFSSGGNVLEAIIPIAAEV